MILKRLRWVYDIKADIRSDVARDANTWLTHMEEYAYRNVHYSNTFITYMSWGVGHSNLLTNPACETLYNG